MNTITLKQDSALVALNFVKSALGIFPQKRHNVLPAKKIILTALHLINVLEIQDQKALIVLKDALNVSYAMAKFNVLAVKILSYQRNHLVLTCAKIRKNLTGMILQKNVQTFHQSVLHLNFWIKPKINALTAQASVVHVQALQTVHNVLKTISIKAMGYASQFVL